MLFVACAMGQVSAEGQPAAKVEKKNALPYIVDERDGQRYPYVQVGMQFWLAKNMNFASMGSYCHEDEASCKKFGRLYTWAAAMILPTSANSSKRFDKGGAKEHQGVCPSGWHIPSDEEWTILYEHISKKKKTDNVDLHLRSKKGWISEDGYNTYGFSAVGSGFRIGGKFDGRLTDTYFWSTTEKSFAFSGNEAFARYITVDYAGFEPVALPKVNEVSVRCVENRANSDFRLGNMRRDSIQWKPSF